MPDMKPWGTAFLLLISLSCARNEGKALSASEPSKTPAAATKPAQAVAPSPMPPPPKAPMVLDESIKSVLRRLSYKPDPYETQPGCRAEERSQVRDDVLLSVRMALSRASDGAIQVRDSDYQVSASTAAGKLESPAALGIPRLELVHEDGRSEASDFVGNYREPGGTGVLSTKDEAPGDPTTVEAWYASAPLHADVIAHRITLDGRVLREFKRPARPPRLSHIECDDTDAKGVRLSWHSETSDAQVPLLVDVLRDGPLGFVEELAFTDARKISGMTLGAKPQAAERDAVLLVSVTDTFSLVTRGVLVPKRAL
jgi:hypothetical protein